MTTAIHLVADDGRTTTYDRLSIVVPVHDTASQLSDFHRRLDQATATLPLLFEIIYVDDGSGDGSSRVLRQLRQRDTRVAVLELSRHFGTEAALMAGLDHAGGDAVLILSADLRDPPELIAEMVTAWRGGYDVVVARRETDTDGWFVSRSLRLFHRALNAASDAPVPERGGDFRLMSRRAVDALRQLPERRRYLKGLFAWTGFPHRIVEYRQAPDAADRSLSAYRMRVVGSLRGLTAFSAAPLRLVTAATAFVALACLAASMVLFIVSVRYGASVSGLRLTAAAMLFVGAVQLFATCLHGEYLGQLYAEAKRRPLYVLRNVQPAADLGGISRAAKGLPQ
jgi:polyisoprenyl-phosphate glycosyltransferase